MKEHSAELTLLGSMLLNSRLVPSVRESLVTGDFRLDTSRVIFRAICELCDQGIAPELPVLAEHLRAAGEMEKAGGSVHLASLSDDCVQTDDVSGYIRIVRTKSLDHDVAQQLEFFRLDLEDGRQPSEVLAERLPNLLLLEQRAAKGSKSRFNLIHASQLDNLPEAEFLHGTHIVKGGYNLWYGLSETGKSLYAMREAYYLALRGPVVYIAAEGSSGLKLRRDAIVDHYDMRLGDIYFITEPINLLDTGQVKAFIADCKRQHPNGILLVVIDTKSRCMSGAEENSAQDDSIQVENSTMIQRELGCAVVLLHHSDKADTTARGSGATFNAADCVLYFKRDDDVVTVSVQAPRGKLKDGERWPDEVFRTIRSADSVVLVPSDEVATEYSDRLTANQSKVLDTLCLAEFEGRFSSATKIADAAGIPKRTLYRVLDSLKVTGFLCQSASGTNYQISPAGKTLVPRSPASVPTDNAQSKPNGQSQLVEICASVPT